MKGKVQSADLRNSSANVLLTLVTTNLYPAVVVVKAAVVVEVISIHGTLQNKKSPKCHALGKQMCLLSTCDLFCAQDAPRALSPKSAQQTPKTIKSLLFTEPFKTARLH